jgi:hypothetical protein
VKILGKGNTVRLCPLWPATVNTLRALADGRDTQDRVFRNRRGARSPASGFTPW